MTESKDLLSLLATIDLGVLAAAVALLALYPAIAGIAQRTGIKVVLGNETKRRLLFSWLGRTAVASGLGLILLLCQAVFGVLIASHPPNCPCADLATSSGRYEQILTWTGAALTASSILAGARVGRLIFGMASDAA